jgi:hypothetical protein
MKLIKQSRGDILDTTAEIVNPYQRCTGKIGCLRGGSCKNRV